MNHKILNVCAWLILLVMAAGMAIGIRTGNHTVFFLALKMLLAFLALAAMSQIAGKIAR